MRVPLVPVHPHQPLVFPVFLVFVILIAVQWKCIIQKDFIEALLGLLIPCKLEDVGMYGLHHGIDVSAKTH